MAREEEVSAISSSLDVQTQVGLLNEAADEVLNAHRWTFLRRYDGFAFFPGRFDGTIGGGVFPAGSTSVFLNFGGGNLWATSNVNAFSTNVRMKLRVTNDTNLSNTSIPITELVADISYPAVLGTDWHGDALVAGAGQWEGFAHEFVLPDTVRQVTYVSDHEGNFPISFVDRDTELEPITSRLTDTFAERPELVTVGGIVTTTEKNNGAGTVQTAARAGTALTVYPAPSSDLLLQYGYLNKFAELAADTDTWTGVPREVQRLIERVAFEHSLDTNVEDDERRARLMHGKNQRMLEKLLAADARDPNRRNVPHEIGARRLGHNPRSRWASDTITGPN